MQVWSLVGMLGYISRFKVECMLLKLLIGEGQGVKGRQDRMGVLGHESQSRKPSKEIQNGGPVFF